MKRSVSIFGWSTIVVSILLIFSELLNLAMSDSMNQITELAGVYSRMHPGVLSTVTALLEYNRCWSLYSIIYFTATLIGGVQFVRFRENGRRILEIACWVGIANACVDSIANYIFWNDMQASMQSLTGGLGIPLSHLNPLGLGTIIAGFLLWVIPSIGIALYLRQPSLMVLMVGKGALDG